MRVRKINEYLYSRKLSRKLIKNYYDHRAK